MFGLVWLRMRGSPGVIYNFEATGQAHQTGQATDLSHSLPLLCSVPVAMSLMTESDDVTDRRRDTLAGSRGVQSSMLSLP